MNNFAELIAANNNKNQVDKEELRQLIEKAQLVHNSNFTDKVWFERSIFINWTCAVADCKYCYLSTKPKYDSRKGTPSLRSRESVLAEVLVCKLLEWEVGYITGGLRVESPDYLISLLNDIELILNKKIMMNFGPYSERMVQRFAPHVSGMGSAIESFDEGLHNFICPSKPLKSLINFLGYLKEAKAEKLITIILGLGEAKEDINLVINNIKEFEIEKIQLCFLKPQSNTIFNRVPALNSNYMAWWIAKLRIACPKLMIKVALVRDRILDISLYLQAGANSFSRFMVLSDFNSVYAQQLKDGCKKADRQLQGCFSKLPLVDLDKEVKQLPFDQELNQRILVKVNQYWDKLKRLELNIKATN